MSTYDVSAIANYFLAKDVKKYNVSQLKLQKLVYIAYGWNLAITKKKLNICN